MYSLLKNKTAYYLIEKVIRIISTLLVMAITSRALSYQDFVALQLILLWMGVGNSVATFGIDRSVVTMQISNNMTEGEALIRCTYLRIFSGMIVYLILICSMVLSGLEAGLTTHLTLAGISMIAGFGDFYEASHQLNNRAEKLVVARIFSSIIIVSLRGILYLLNMPFEYYIYALIFDSALISILNIRIACLKNIKVKKLFESSTKNIFIMCLSPAGSSLLLSIYNRIDQIIIVSFVGNSILGVYSPIKRIIEAATTLSSSYISSATQNIATEFKTSSQSLNQSMEMFFRNSFLWGTVGFVLVAATSPLILMLLLGKNYVTYWPILAISALALPAFGVGQARATYFMVASLNHYHLIFALIGIISNALLGCILLPLIGIYGAAISFVFSSYISTIISSCFFDKTKDCWKWQISSLKSWWFLLR